MVGKARRRRGGGTAGGGGEGEGVRDDGAARGAASARSCPGPELCGRRAGLRGLRRWRCLGLRGSWRVPSVRRHPRPPPPRRPGKQASEKRAGPARAWKPRSRVSAAPPGPARPGLRVPDAVADRSGPGRVEVEGLSRGLGGLGGALCACDRARDGAGPLA